MTRPSPEGGESKRVFLDAGKNPASGAVVHYHLPEEVDEELTLTFLDIGGGVIRSFSSKEAATASDLPAEQRDPLAPAKQGLNRFEWNLRGASATRVPCDVTTAAMLNGPAMPPSTYKVQLKIGDQVLEQSFALLKDPRIRATQEDLDAQFELLTSIRDTLSKANGSINQLRSVVTQIDEWTKRAEGRPDTEAIAQAATQVKEKLEAIEESSSFKRRHESPKTPGSTIQAGSTTRSAFWQPRSPAPNSSPRSSLTRSWLTTQLCWISNSAS